MKTIIENEKIINLKDLAMANLVPYVRDKTAIFLNEYIKNNHYQSLLEIGSAVGYSSHILLHDNKDIKFLDTIEKNSSLHELAKANAFDNRINFICADAFDYKYSKKYDFIFMDGSKSKQKELLLKLKNFLNPNGTIIIDNIFLNKVRQVKNKTMNQKHLIEKVDNFKNWLEHDQKLFYVEILAIDDGIAICKER